MYPKRERERERERERYMYLKRERERERASKRGFYFCVFLPSTDYILLSHIIFFFYIHFLSYKDIG
jgi:hypothetical protein